MSVQQRPRPVRPPQRGKRAKRTRLAPQARKEQILAAALVAFGRGGYHGTHVEDVIREAGVARGTFYLYFPGKHEVFAALVERMLAIFLEARPPLPEPEIRTLADAERVLRSSYMTLFGVFRMHRELCRLLFDEAVGLDKGFADLLAQHFAVWHERVASTLRTFQERRLARADLDVEITADLVLGMVERLTRRHLFAARPPDLERLVDAVVAFELRGIQRAR
jgi:AcrR family transcriptional regulator